MAKLKDISSDEESVLLANGFKGMPKHTSDAFRQGVVLGQKAERASIISICDALYNAAYEFEKPNWAVLRREIMNRYNAELNQHHKPKLRFEELPIIFDEIEYEDGWRRNIEREGTILELLDTWDIDSPTENAEIAQVLRYLREFMQNGQITKASISANPEETP